MSAAREDKPTWDAVPSAVRDLTEQMLGARVSSARRAFGGYGPSATFVLKLDDDRTAFFKGVYPLPEGSAVRWALDEEERVYTQLADEITPWAPVYYGSIRHEGWHAMLIESVPGARMPPWTVSQAERAARSYAEFHARTVDAELPEWLERTQHLEFAGYWSQITTDKEASARLAALCPTPALRRDATEWINANGSTLASAEEPLLTAERFALLHFDTRSDNVRLDRDLLRLFDWPWACVGPPEFDAGAFAQSIAAEGGPDPEQVIAWYQTVLPLDADVLTASVVGISGYFADRAPRPAMEGLPRLRSVQRRQLKASLLWAAGRLQLGRPDWLQSVAD
ncbi:MAG TPA: aminoglycoside phosphotransferase family protein [Candidatus Limnocylindrales bacterium]